MKSPAMSTTPRLLEERRPRQSVEENRAALRELMKSVPQDAIGGNQVSNEGRQELEARMFNRPSCRPPVNNAIMPDIYDKLDAQARERTRVMNAVLKQRLGVQERVIRRHRVLSEKFHHKEQQRIRTELRRIEKCLPSFVTICKDSQDVPQRSRQSLVHVTKAVPDLPSETHFCYRYFDHHNPAKTAQKISNEIQKSMEAADRNVRELMMDIRSRDIGNKTYRLSMDTASKTQETNNGDSNNVNNNTDEGTLGLNDAENGLDTLNSEDSTLVKDKESELIHEKSNLSETEIVHGSPTKERTRVSHDNNSHREEKTRSKNIRLPTIDDQCTPDVDDVLDNVSTIDSPDSRR